MPGAPGPWSEGGGDMRGVAQDAVSGRTPVSHGRPSRSIPARRWRTPGCVRPPRAPITPLVREPEAERADHLVLFRPVLVGVECRCRVAQPLILDASVHVPAAEAGRPAERHGD